MFKTIPGLGGRTARCLTLLPILTLLVLAFSSPVQAQFHGVAMAKSCSQPVRVCDDASDCSDGDLCTADFCDDTNPNTTECFIRVTNDDDEDDTLQINAAWDTVHTAGGDVRVPLAGNLPIDEISGNTDCVVGAFAVCEIGPDIGGGPGRVIFRSAGYNPVPADLALPDSKVLDDGTVVVQDLCDAPGTQGCSESPQEQNFGAATTLVDACSNGPTDPCNDNDACTLDSCNPDTGLCVNIPDPSIDCNDNDACTLDSCNPDTGLCVNIPDPSIDCNDNDACTLDSCNPDTGLCVNIPDPSIDCNDNDACTLDSCNPDTGLCVNIPDPSINCNDNDACTLDSCNPDTGLCVNIPDPSIDCNDNDACTLDSCNPDTGLCVNIPDPSIVCNDNDICTDDSCNPDTGLCVFVPADPLPAECLAVEICRTPGFWATHGGVEKGSRSQNITQAVIDSAMGLDVCGTIITNTAAGNSASAIEAMCVSVKGVKQRQLVRQLTAAALNCELSGGAAGDCNMEHQDLVADCNLTCADGSGVRSVNECIDEIDCFNNGGAWDMGACLYNPGRCDVSGELCEIADDCTGLGDTDCVLDITCHDLSLCEEDSDFCFEPPGPAGSTGACKTARKNTVYVP